MDAITRQDLFIKTPWLNAAGTLGFRPPRVWPWPEEPGAFVTNPISIYRRTPAEERGLLPYSGGILLHTGLPNPGIRAVIKGHGQRWSRLDLPLWVHLLADSPVEISQMVELLEKREDIAAVEVGIPPKASGQEALVLMHAAGIELPVIACVPLDRAGESWVLDLPSAGASAVCIMPQRGAMPDSSGKLISGRLYGPGLFPQMLSVLQRLNSITVPVIAGCGVYSRQDGQHLLDAGAWAVQLDLVLWGNQITASHPIDAD
jgi:dihydroorotate dehydrogenase (NAD+) catalytic subunit